MAIENQNSIANAQRQIMAGTVRGCVKAKYRIMQAFPEPSESMKAVIKILEEIMQANFEHLKAVDMDRRCAAQNVEAVVAAVWADFPSFRHFGIESYDTEYGKPPGLNFSMTVQKHVDWCKEQGATQITFKVWDADGNTLLKKYPIWQVSDTNTVTVNNE
jgi:hypothetical protein